MSTRRSGVMAGLLLWLLASSGLARAGVESLTLYQKTARASLVVRARALSDSTRKPQMEVLEIFKGSYPARTLTIIPHFEDYSTPTPWLRREVFRKGQVSILFLARYTAEFGHDEGPDSFALVNADQGRLEVPAEGEEALVEAVHRFTTILSLEQHDRQASALRELLRAKNPYMIEAALAECRKFRLAEPEDTDALLGMLENRRADFRAGALALLGQLLIDARVAGRLEPQARQSIFEHVAASARLDDNETVRKDAVETLEAIGDPAALAVITSIGETDTSQNVRYEAQVAAYRLKEKLH